MTRTLRKYGKTAAMSAMASVGDSLLFLIDFGMQFLRVVVLLALWRTLLGDKGAVNGMTLAAALTYTVIAEAFSDFLAGRTEMIWAFWNGSIATRFLRPMGIFAQFVVEAFGQWMFAFCCFSIPLLLCAPLLGVNPLPASVAAGLLFLVSLALGLAVGLALEFLFGALAITLGLELYAVQRIQGAVGVLLSGAFIPLALLPWGIGRVLDWLPFASMASAPLRIYTGTGDPARLMALQAVWCILLWPLATALWNRSRERMVSFGG